MADSIKIVIDVVGKARTFLALPVKDDPALYRIPHQELMRAFTEEKRVRNSLRMETGIVGGSFTGKFGPGYSAASCRIVEDDIPYDTFFGEAGGQLDIGNGSPYVTAVAMAQDKAVLDFFGIETRFFTKSGVPVPYGKTAADVEEESGHIETEAETQEEKKRAVMTDEIRAFFDGSNIEPVFDDERPWMNVLKYRISNRFGDRRDFIHVPVPVLKGKEKHSIRSLEESIVALADSFDADLYYELLCTKPAGPFGFIGTTEDFKNTGATVDSIFAFDNSLCMVADEIAKAYDIGYNDLLGMDASVAEWMSTAFPSISEDSFVSRMSKDVRFSDLAGLSDDEIFLKLTASKSGHMAGDDSAIGFIKAALNVRSRKSQLPAELKTT